MIFRTVLTTLLLTLCLGMDAQANESPKQASIFALQPFERAICCIKYYEGIHRKKDYPYVGYGHKLRPGEQDSWKQNKIPQKQTSEEDRVREP